MERRDQKKEKLKEQKATEELIDSLTPEQKKQWNSYSRHEKRRVLRRVSKRTGMRMQGRMQAAAREDRMQRRRKAGNNKNWRADGDTDARAKRPGRAAPNRISPADQRGTGLLTRPGCRNTGREIKTYTGNREGDQRKSREGDLERSREGNREGNREKSRERNRERNGKGDREGIWEGNRKEIRERNRQEFPVMQKPAFSSSGSRYRQIRGKSPIIRRASFHRVPVTAGSPKKRDLILRDMDSQKSTDQRRMISSGRAEEQKRPSDKERKEGGKSPQGEKRSREEKTPVSGDKEQKSSGRDPDKKQGRNGRRRQRQDFKRPDFEDKKNRPGEKSAGRKKVKEEKRPTAVETARKKIFRNEFVTLLSKDSRKREAVKQAQKAEQITMTEQETATGADALRTALLPGRAVVRKLKKKIARNIRAVFLWFLKYAAAFGGILFLLLFLVLFISSLIGSVLEENEENGSPFYSATGEEIVAYAKEWIGITRYVYDTGRASDTDWQDVSDCSSFVHGVFSHFGIEVGWTTYEMENRGTVITGGIDHAVPGDIILYYNGYIAPDNSVHVGIYAGDGMIVHNSSTQGHVVMAPVNYSSRPYEIRRFVSDVQTGSTDNTKYTREQMEVIWAVVHQEDQRSYEGALAVISTAMNRVNSPKWAYCGSNAYEQLTHPGQFCYSNDGYWKKFLHGNVPDRVKQAVSDCLEKGIRNHPYTSFRSYYMPGSVQIAGGNYYYNE